MLLTPVLWRLEPALGMELAGHSGPSDWVFYVIWSLLIPALFLSIKFGLFCAGGSAGQISAPPVTK
jgi:hypothetical protein